MYFIRRCECHFKNNFGYTNISEVERTYVRDNIYAISNHKYLKYVYINYGLCSLHRFLVHTRFLIAVHVTRFSPKEINCKSTVVIATRARNIGLLRHLSTISPLVGVSPVRICQESQGLGLQKTLGFSLPFRLSVKPEQIIYL